MVKASDKIPTVGLREKIKIIFSRGENSRWSLDAMGIRYKWIIARSDLVGRAASGERTSAKKHIVISQFMGCDAPRRIPDSVSGEKSSQRENVSHADMHRDSNASAWCHITDVRNRIEL